MIEAAEAIAAFFAGRDRATLDTDQMLLFALVRAVEVLGEAASRVSETTRLAAPAVPWGKITAMRNRLIHAYCDIDRDIVWKTAAHEIPELDALLRALITEPRSRDRIDPRSFPRARELARGWKWLTPPRPEPSATPSRRS